MTLIKVSSVIIMSAMVLAGCGSSGGGSGTSSTYTLSGNMDQNASSSGISSSSLLRQFKDAIGLKSNSRTQCNDGFYYSVYCVSFSTPPVAAEGNVDCTGGGAFEVAGLPKGEAIGCFVRRYESATASSNQASTVGAIQIPAANLNGSTEQMVSSGDVNLNVTISETGTISATVVSGTVNDSVDDSAASNFTPTNMNGVWALRCSTSGGSSTFTDGLCKCFLGESQLAGAGYTDEKDCLADSNGPGAAITGSVEIGIGLYVYSASTNNSIDVGNGQSIPSGSTINGISIWAAPGSPGSYTSLKTGGEGATNLGGDLTWSTTPLDPTAAITWATSIDPDGAGPIGAVTIPAVPAATANHAAWISWAQTVTANADTAGWNCQTTANNPNQHVWCMNEALDLIGDGQVVFPGVHIMPFCDQNGCVISTDTGEFTGNDGNANALKMARVEVEGLHFDHDGQGTWTTGSDYDALTPDSDGIGIEPEARFVFEPLEFFPGGAGFRQGNHDERHYKCGATTHEVQNSACSDAGDHFELKCHSREELAIKFLGDPTSGSVNVVFDQSESVGYAKLVRHTGSGPQEISPNGTTAVEMCVAKRGGGGGIFTATAVRQ